MDINRLLKRPQMSESKIKYKSRLGLHIATLAMFLSLGSAGLMYKLNDSKPDSLTVAITKDIEEDSFDNSVPLYSSPSASEVSTVLKNQALILTMDSIDDSSKKIYKVFALGDDNKFIEGYIPKEYIDSSAELGRNNVSSIYVVADKKGVNLRSSADVTPENKIGTIPSGSILLGSSSTSPNNSWTDIVYYTGTSLDRGYVSSEFIKKVGNLTNESIENHEVKPTYIVQDDHVFGIDVSDINEKRLEALLKGDLDIPDVVESRNGKKINISKFDNRKINFVYIKLMASKVFSEKIGKGFSTKYDKLAAICEKYQIPYGFYYYSTCIDKDEAKLEYQWISESLDKLNKKDYNLLPLAIDVEVHSDKDRQLRKPIKTVTSAKAELANLIEKKYGKTILYTSRNACDPALKSRVLDVNQYQKELTSGNSHIWFVAPKKSPTHQKSLNKIAQHVHAKQIVLDVKTDEKEYNLLDINVIGKTAYEQYMSGEYRNVATKPKPNIKTVAELERD